MLEGLVFVIKVISFILKKFWYGGKSKFWKEFESGKMEFGKVIQRQEIELQRCWEGKLVFFFYNVFIKKVSFDFVYNSNSYYIKLFYMLV